MLIFLLPAMYELQGNAMVHCNNGWVFMLSNAKFILLDITQSCHAICILYTCFECLSLVINCGYSASFYHLGFDFLKSLFNDLYMLHNCSQVTVKKILASLL